MRMNKMKNVLIAMVLTCGLFTGQVAYAEEDNYAEAENILDIDPAYTDEIKEATGYTVINDRVGFDRQKNYYSFTAPVSGEYSFTFIPSAGITRYDYTIKDGYDGLVATDTFVEDEKKIIELLDEGMTYTIMFGQYTNYGKYSIKIDYPSSAQQFLDDFSQGITDNTNDTIQDVETEEEYSDLAKADDSDTLNEDLIIQQLEEITSRLDTLESEMNEVIDENEDLKAILEENEIEYD